MSCWDVKNAPVFKQHLKFTLKFTRVLCWPTGFTEVKGHTRNWSNNQATKSQNTWKQLNLRGEEVGESSVERLAGAHQTT